MRTIRTTGEEPSQAVADAIEAVMVAELLSPSDAVWLVSPWISDIPVVDNTDGRYAGVTNLPRRHLSLTEVFDRLSRAGTALTVVTRDDPSNGSIVEYIRELERRDRTTRLVIAENVHEKTLLTDRVVLSGSMNFTFSGTGRNAESLTIFDEQEEIGSAHVELADNYESHDAG